MLFWNNKQEEPRSHSNYDINSHQILMWTKYRTTMDVTNDHKLISFCIQQTTYQVTDLSVYVKAIKLHISIGKTENGKLKNDRRHHSTWFPSKQSNSAILNSKWYYQNKTTQCSCKQHYNYKNRIVFVSVCLRLNRRIFVIVDEGKGASEPTTKPSYRCCHLYHSTESQ